MKKLLFSPRSGKSAADTYKPREFEADSSILPLFTPRPLKRIIISAALAVALGIAGLIASRQDVTHPASEPPTPAAQLSKLPAKTERIDEEHHPARFDSLDDGMKKIAEELEAAAIKWQRARPLHESAHKTWNDWDDFSTVRIEELNTAQIRLLGEWVTDEATRYVSELNDYRQAIIKVWASREPDLVRSHLLKIAERKGHLGKEVNSWPSPGLDELCDNFHFYHVGHAMLDPKGALETFFQYDADPRMKDLVSPMTTLPELFREYAARAPEEAWSLALGMAGEDYHHRMIEAFADGAPAGQDWERRGRDLIGSLSQLDIDLSPTTFEAIAERWVMEHPAAALDWFARKASGVAEFQTEDRFAPNHVESIPRSPEEVAVKMKLDLLVGMYHSHKDRSTEVISALDQLANRNRDPIAALVLGALIGESLDPMDTPLLGLIPKFPQREVRDELFLRALEAIPTRAGNPSLSSSDSLEGPNLTLEAVRELAGKLDITPEIRAKAEEVFHKVEAAELHALEVQEQLRRSKSDDANGDDPFSSR